VQKPVKQRGHVIVGGAMSAKRTRKPFQFANQFVLCRQRRGVGPCGVRANERRTVALARRLDGFDRIATIIGRVKRQQSGGLNVADIVD
jgi:hypothetical protein